MTFRKGRPLHAVSAGTGRSRNHKTRPWKAHRNHWANWSTKRRSIEPVAPTRNKTGNLIPNTASASRTSPPQFFTQPEKPEQQKTYASSPMFSNWYHQLLLLEQLLRFFGLPSIFISISEENFWLLLKTVFMGQSHVVKISQYIHREALLSRKSLSENTVMKEVSSGANLKCRLGQSIAHFFIFETDGRILF